jgi:tRNA(fMet)-specific endonuclease VapC
MRLMLDTNRYDDLNSGDPSVVRRVETAAEVWLSLVVVAELRAGFLEGSQQRRNERILSKFLSKPTVDILMPTAVTTEFYARIWVALRKQGTRIPTNDIWIAAQAVENDLALDTRDKHFHHVPGLNLVPAET